MREKKCPGRPRARRCLTGGGARCMMPACRRGESTDFVTLLPEEVEAIRLADLLDLEQEEIAQQMGVSRKTVWKDLNNARKKIADAIINGKGLHMESCGSEKQCECEFKADAEGCMRKRCRRGQQVTDLNNDTAED